MKRTLLISFGVLFVLFILYYVFVYKKDAKTATGETDENPNPAPVDADLPGASALTPLFVDSGAGYIAVQTRIEQLRKGGEYKRQLNNIDSSSLYSGVQKPAAFQGTFGGMSNIGWPLTDGGVSAIRDGINLSDSGNQKQQMQTVQRLNLSFDENNLPMFLSNDFKGGGEKNFFKDYVCNFYGDCPNNYDLHKNSSAWTSAGKLYIADVRKLASNVDAINTQVSNLVREKAISDLVTSGWKFVGYTT